MLTDDMKDLVAGTMFRGNDKRGRQPQSVAEKFSAGA